MKAYYGSRISEHMTETPEGYLICLGVPIARTGSQKYLSSELGMEDSAPNKMVKVGRTEDEVFAQATIASFEGKPVTDDHPPESVNPQNIMAYDCGHVQNVRRGVGSDSDLLFADLFITNSRLIDAIKGGRREVSCGYDCEYVQDEDGNIYQRAIRGNHVAVVENGRAGHRVAIKDSCPKDNSHSERGKNKMAKDNSLFARLFSRAVRDMEPEEIEDAIEEMAATAATGGMNDIPDAEPEFGGAEPSFEQKITDALDKINARLDQLENGGAQAPVDADPMTALENELTGKTDADPALDPTAMGELPQDEDPEAALTVPAEEIGADADPEIDPSAMPMDGECDAPEAPASTLPKNPIKSADRQAALYALNAIKPVIASLPKYQRKAASDKAVAEIRKMMGKTARARSNGYLTIQNNMKGAAKGRTADSAAKNEKLGAEIMAKRNPHYKGNK